MCREYTAKRRAGPQSHWHVESLHAKRSRARLPHISRRAATLFGMLTPMPHDVWKCVGVNTAAIPVTWLWVWVLDRYIDRFRYGAEKASRRWLLPVTMGIIERIVYTILVGYCVTGAAGFIGAWVTIKAVGGWAKWSGDQSTDYTRAAFTVGLLGSALSVIFGVVGGLIIRAWTGCH